MEKQKNGKQQNSHFLLKNLCKKAFFKQKNFSKKAFF